MAQRYDKTGLLIEQPPARELAISERRLPWLLERHAELLKRLRNTAITAIPLGILVELEAIEDEVMDRDDMRELGFSRLTDDERAAVQVVLERGWNR